MHPTRLHVPSYSLQWEVPLDFLDAVDGLDAVDVLDAVDAVDVLNMFLHRQRRPCRPRRPRKIQITCRRNSNLTKTMFRIHKIPWCLLSKIWFDSERELNLVLFHCLMFYVLISMHASSFFYLPH